MNHLPLNYNCFLQFIKLITFSVENHIKIRSKTGHNMVFVRFQVGTPKKLQGNPGSGSFNLNSQGFCLNIGCCFALHRSSRVFQSVKIVQNIHFSKSKSFLFVFTRFFAKFAKISLYILHKI